MDKRIQEIWGKTSDYQTVLSKSHEKYAEPEIGY